MMESQADALIGALQQIRDNLASICQWLRTISAEQVRLTDTIERLSDKKEGK